MVLAVRSPRGMFQFNFGMCLSRIAEVVYLSVIIASKVTVGLVASV